MRASVETYFESKAIFVPERYTFVDEETRLVRQYDLDHIQRFFMTFHEPSSCFIATVASNSVMLVIVINIVVNILMTLPQYRSVAVDSCNSPACDNDSVLCPGTVICAPTTDAKLVTIDDWCVIIFTIEYFFRLLTVWSVPMRLANLVPKGWDEEEMFVAGHEDREALIEPKQKWYSTTLGYFFQGKNLIDLVAILPFYITLADPGSSASLSFIRALRLFRIVRAFNMNASAGVTNLIIRTVQESLEVIMLLLFFSSMIIIIFGSIIVDAEAGTYTVSTDYPDGAYVRKGVDGDYERTPFVSTIMGMYWAVITMTTVGYGDIVPVSNVGRMIAVACAFIGVLFMALPISILGANFTVQYQRLSANQRQERKRRTSVMLAKKASLKTGKEIKVKPGAVEMTFQGQGEVEVEVEGEEGRPGEPTLDSLDLSHLKTGNRMADAIMLEKAKDEKTMASIYHNKKPTVAGGKKLDYDSVSVSDIDDQGSAHSPRGGDNIDEFRHMLVAFNELEERIHDEHIGTIEKREVLGSFQDNLRIISDALRTEAREDVIRAERRAIVLNTALGVMTKSCQHILDGVPEE